MTRRIATAALFLLIASQGLASTTQRYVVALKRSVNTERAAGLLRDIDASTPARPRAHNLSTFTTLNSFAADLTDEEAAELRSSRDVRYVEPVVERHALGLTAAAAATETRSLTGQTVPLGIDAVHARDVWRVTRGKNTNVVVVDTGVDYNHPDLKRGWAGGYNAITRTNDPLDDNGHGTHVAGTIAADDNGLGVLGVAPDVRLWSVKVLKSDGNGTTGSIVAALDWVIKKKQELGGNWVLNFSLGSDKPSIAEREAFTKAVQEGLLIVAASGNESTQGLPAPVGYPAAYAGVLAVGAVDSQRRIAVFSNQGPELALVAPGVNVLSTIRPGTGSFAAVQTANGTTFTGNELTGSKKGSVTGSFVYCGLGRTTEFPPQVNGQIAVITRGSINFSEKARNAKAAGATAVVIVNNDTSALNFTLISADDPTTTSFDWPVTIAISKNDGETLIASGGAITVADRADDYGYLSGTSMATPHATGVAALVWSVDPNANAANIRLAMAAAADDLGAPGFDTIYGNGMADALSAAKMLAPAAFVAPNPSDPAPSGRRVLRRGSH